MTAGADQAPVHQEPGTQVWMYPSQQMFYNAMKRKGWQPSEDDMVAIVAIHNGVNERAWSEVGPCHMWLPQVCAVHDSRAVWYTDCFVVGGSSHWQACAGCRHATL